MPAFHTLDDLGDLTGKTALVRVDVNVPMDGGRITDDTRLRAALPTIGDLCAKGAKVALLAHFDRPKGKRVPTMSLAPVAGPLGALLGVPVAFADDCVGAAAKAVIAALKPGQVALLENVRFHPGEETNAPEFVAALAQLGDLYVNDAFSAVHRAHASTEGLAHLLPAYAGRSLQRELAALDLALGAPKRPVVGIVGGSKVSTKLDLLQNLVARLDTLAIGGGMANTFLYAMGHAVGGSLCEKDLADTVRGVIAQAKTKACELLLPIDVVCADALTPGVATAIRDLGGVAPTDKIFDAGPRSVARLNAAIDLAHTVVWNGPLGVFEVPPFDAATLAVARHTAERAKTCGLIAVAGGGDTVAALHAAGVTDDFSFVSTAGGAFLEWMEGKALPGVEALRPR
jgi:phosphoglycerate kinase